MVKDQESKIICACALVSKADIKSEIHRQICSLKDLQDSLGCGVECGSCIPKLHEMLGINVWHSAYALCEIIDSTKKLDTSRHVYEIKLFLNDMTAYPEPDVGQNIIIRFTRMDDQTIERTYTIVDFDSAQRSLMIIAKHRVKGKLTPIFAHSAIDPVHPLQLEISEPVGDSFVVNDQQPIVFYVAGSGITPALAYINKYTGKNSMYLDYSAKTNEELIYQDFFSLKKEQMKNFDYILRQTNTSGRLSSDDVEVNEKKSNGAQQQYIICGPREYTKMVSATLRMIGVASHSIHTEAFYFEGTQAFSSKVSKKKIAYGISFFLCLMPLTFLNNNMEGHLPHEIANIGHEKLKCVDCHQASLGSFRQQLQAKAAYTLGLRENDVYFGNKPVNTRTCLECHANPDDRHSAQRFLEPKYKTVRKALAVHQCITCHREHSGRRVTLSKGSYCMECHTNTVVKNDPATPSHKTLIKNKRWATCLQCHDFHGNHKYKTQKSLVLAKGIEEIHQYFRNAENPYGPIKLKAKQPLKDKK